jgi:phospho-N-acetylmuramoyl-pentapeptide-transferase
VSTIKEESEALTRIQLQQKSKFGTPIGGGILIISLVTVVFIIAITFFSSLGIIISRNYQLNQELNILFFTFISFGLLGLYDDLVKIFNITNFQKKDTVNLRKNVLILFLSFVISLMLYFNLHIQILNLPFVGILNLSWLIIPFFTLIITFFTKAVDITDGLDGLAGGCLLISLLSFWAISLTSLDSVLSVFISLWIGSLLAFLYFNVYPARIWLGNAGSLSFGATLAVIGLLLGKSIVMVVICLVFVLEALSQILQILYLAFTHKKLFTVTPLHYLLQNIGWPEPKIVQRLWLVGILASILGLWLTEF